MEYYSILGQIHVDSYPAEQLNIVQFDIWRFGNKIEQMDWTMEQKADQTENDENERCSGSYLQLPYVCRSSDISHFYHVLSGLLRAFISATP